LTSGGGGANTVDYFDDQTGWWADNLDLYKAALPKLYGVGYIQVLKRKLCQRTWQSSAGICALPTL